MPQIWEQSFLVGQLFFEIVKKKSFLLLVKASHVTVSREKPKEIESSRGYDFLPKPTKSRYWI